jgi:hypothetical protein
MRYSPTGAEDELEGLVSPYDGDLHGKLSSTAYPMHPDSRRSLTLAGKM